MKFQYERFHDCGHWLSGSYAMSTVVAGFHDVNIRVWSRLLTGKHKHHGWQRKRNWR